MKVDRRIGTYLRFTAYGMLAYVILGAGSEIAARVIMTDEGFLASATEAARYVSLGTITYFMFPYILVSWIVAPISGKYNAPVASGALLILGFLAIGGIYFYGCLSAWYAISKHASTAAALTEGLIPLLCVPVLLAVFMAKYIVAKKLAKPH